MPVAHVLRSAVALASGEQHATDCCCVTTVYFTMLLGSSMLLCQALYCPTLVIATMPGLLPAALLPMSESSHPSASPIAPAFGPWFQVSASSTNNSDVSNASASK
eukprot:GHRR01032027.1.p1 GENE.GHRR01032027.1~~GHRR01032027.1.p1  ORF type:complete len:105 (-),score=16.56 GHRR01032027.1:23-337(-)